MTEYVFKAADSESAMDKAVRELGDDAMILSIRRIGNLTEVRAIKQTFAAVASHPPEPMARRRLEEPFANGVSVERLNLEQALRSVQKRRDHKNGIEDMRQDSHEGDDLRQQPYPEADRLQTWQTSPLDIDPYEKARLKEMLDTHERAPEITNAHLMQQLPSDLPSTTLTGEQKFQRSDLSDDAVSVPSEAVLRTDGQFGCLPDKELDLPVESLSAGRSEPSHPAIGTAHTWKDTPYQSIGIIGHDPSSSTPQTHQPRVSGSKEHGSDPMGINLWGPPSERIARHGFPDDIARACSIAPELHSPKAQLDHACKLLADRLDWPEETSPLHRGGVLFIFGPPGAGKTTVAAQIAFERIQTHGVRPKLTKLSRESFVSDGRLKHHALLLNTVYTETLWYQPQKCSISDILDCDITDPEQVQEAYDLISLNNQDTDVTPVMIIPGTWSVLAIKYYCQAFKQLAPATILTHMNIGGIGVAGLSALSDVNARLVAASETQKITDGLTPVDQLSIEQFLLDAFTYIDTEVGAGL